GRSKTGSDQKQRIGKSLEHHLDCRPSLPDALPEIKRCDITKKTAELHQDRLVQADLLCKCCTLRIRRTERQHQGNRITGKPCNHEYGRGHTEHNQHALEKTTEDEFQHDAFLLSEILSQARPAAGGCLDDAYSVTFISLTISLAST